MAIFVLVHGGNHGGWCWDKVASLLRKNGHIVEAPDLPGHGKDKTPIQDVTLQSCVDKISKIISMQSEPVILVGHSISGIIISQIAERIPEKITLLVYLSAYLLNNGESLELIFEKFRPLLNISEDGSYFTNKKETIADLLYNDCSTDDIAKAKVMLVPEATSIFKTSLHLSENNFGRVPRAFIECLNDKTIPIQVQKTMYTKIPCLKVISLNTGHSPFLSAPEQLATCLLSLTN